MKGKRCTKEARMAAAGVGLQVACCVAINPFIVPVIVLPGIPYAISPAFGLTAD
jgi:hypothetical protein